MSTKSIVISVVIFLAVIIGLSVFLTTGQKSVSAKITASADLGEMKVSDVGQKDFELKNTGTKPLQILNINSSWNCTFGQIIYKGTESKKFGMHAQSGYVTDIAPGDSAVVRVIYQPAIMPVSGPVEREVYVTTNDPERSKLIFVVKANVQ